MNVYVSVDMEGIAGVSHPDPTGRDDKGYDRAVELMLGEANAAIEGALKGGGEDVVVNDSHGSMFNLPPERLHADARLVQGQKPFSMVEAARDGRFDVALFVGYHARAGHPRGTIAHTYSGKPTLTTLNGRPVGEYGINALYLGGLGIPVGMVAGDDALAEEVEEWLPWAERVVVKRAVGYSVAASLSPADARAAIRDGMQRAMARLPEMRPYVPPALIGEIDFRLPVMADYAAVVPGTRRTGSRTVEFEAADGDAFYRTCLSLIRLAAVPTV